MLYEKNGHTPTTNKKPERREWMTSSSSSTACYIVVVAPLSESGCLAVDPRHRRSYHTKVSDLFLFVWPPYTNIISAFLGRKAIRFFFPGRVHFSAKKKPRNIRTFQFLNGQRKKLGSKMCKKSNYDNHIWIQMCTVKAKIKVCNYGLLVHNCLCRMMSSD